MKKRKINKTVFLLIIYLGFVVLGLPDTGFGVAWNEMRLTFNSPLSSAGFVTMIITLCSALSGFLCGYLLQRFDTGKVAVISSLLTAVAIFGFSLSNAFWHLLLLAIPLGIGAGAIDVRLNTYATENLTPRQMNWLHGCWGIGATLSPIIMTTTIVVDGNWRLGYLIIGLLILCLTFLLVYSLPMWQTSSTKKNNDEQISEKPDTKGLAPFLSVSRYFVYAIIESGIGLWLSALLIEGRGVSIAIAGTMVSIYFGSIMFGRFVMGIIANHLGNRKLISLGLFLLCIGAILLCFKEIEIVYCFGILLIGLGLSPLFPTMMHETASIYNQKQSQRIISYQVAIAYVGTLLSSPIIGIIMNDLNLEALPFICLLLSSILILITRKLNALT